ncbi:GNAT family N-acetyltransferase [Chryseobacterium sp. T16E-39]|uniref:GNAT family N-acetyltransferase n=1 Tax=Chryseobacterium sp. T16E-39 TaxID=2015076 RepID=UPI000B5B2A62|nr:GNAT family N-acetyltransferase [Chryseobacterium sp. T16E-39]ASK29277.1 GNAT family N-acetyltransferase [Chryseobacterium sp. T16E-39]
MEVKEAKTRAEIEFCKEVILQFRTNLSEDNYVDQTLEMMAEEGFKLLYIANDQDTKAVAFIGYRPLQMLRTGKIIYIDDLFTSEECRGKGYAGILLDEVAKEAEITNIQSIHLDSGYMLHTAHRLYLNKGYVLACNHFAKKIS